MKNIRNKIIALTLLALPIAYVVSAQSIFTDNLGSYPGGVFNITNLVNLIRRLACYFIQFGIIAVGVAFIIYGIMFLKSRGNAQEFGGAKKSITWGIVGGLVIFSVFTIILTVADFIGVNYSIIDILKCS